MARSIALAAGLLALGASQALASPPPAPPPTVRVRAQLVDTGTPTSHCGIFHFKPVMKFRVTSVLGAELPGQHPGDDPAARPTLFVAVSCPEMPPSPVQGFTFERDASYEMVLLRNGVAPGGVVIDAFEAEPGMRHELLWIAPTADPA